MNCHRDFGFASDRWGLTAEEADALDLGGEHFAAGLLSTDPECQGDDPSWVARHARAMGRHLRRCALRPYRGEPLYPAGGSIWSPCRAILGLHEMPEPVVDLTPYYVSLDLCLNGGAARRRADSAASAVERSAFLKLAAFCDEVPRGGGWTHSIANFERVLGHGMALPPAARGGSAGASPSRGDGDLLRAALGRVLDAVRLYRDRLIARVASAELDGAEAERNRARVLAAYSTGVPFRAPSGFFEAMLAVTFTFALDGSDDLGRFDQYMASWYERALADGEMDRGEAVALIRALWRYVDACGGWNVALGGTTRTGEAAYSDLTLACLEAAQGMRRPNLALRLRRDTPDEVWDAALDTIATGAGLPALYCEENYLEALDDAHLGLSDEDMRDFAFGGCTETMVQGCSNVGSLDADINVLQVMETTLRARLAACASFEDLLAAFEADVREEVRAITERVSRNQEIRARCHPQLIRTLLIDDCAARGREYYAGGARCNWSVINVVGLSNVIDSLSAVRRAVYADRRVGAAALLDALAHDFVGHDDLRAYLEACPRFGNDEPEVDALAHRLSALVYGEFQRYAPWRGGRFLCGTLMFVTYGWFGRPVGATPDGRSAGAPVGDSAGPVQGRDRHGPTAMLRSVASLAQRAAPGTLVVNLRLMPELLRTPEGRDRVRALAESYFAMGGMQIQINIVDQQTLEDAIALPERHADLIVRVGGYSEYFNRLDDDLQRSILERTAHG